MASNLTLSETTADALASDSAFGPASSTRDFDFTLTFEQSILSILPSALLFLIASLRLIQLSRRTSRTLPHIGHAFKTTAAAINLALQLALLILWSSSPLTRTRTSIPSAVLSFVTSGIILALSHLEDKKATRPSIVLNIYLLLSILLDSTQVRTLWLIDYGHVAAAQSAAIGIKIAMLLLEAQTKVPHLMAPYKDYPPEATSGIWNLSFVWWLNRLFVKGFRKLMTTQDLFDIDRDLTSEVLGDKLQSAWDKREIPEGSYALPKVVAWCFRWNLLAAAFPRLCMIGFNFAQPFLIASAINYLEGSSLTKNKNSGYGLIGAAFLIYFGIAMSTVHFKQQFSRVSTMFRGGMISLLYNKTLSLQEGVCTESAVLTLMSTDIDNIIEFLEKINNIWACSVEIAIGTWLLERQLGATCVVPLIVTLICAIGQGWVAKAIGKDQQRWNEAIQQRVKNTSSMLGSMKAIKLSGLVENTSSNIQIEREQELKTSRSFFWGIMWLNGLASLPRVWAPVISFIVFAIQATVKRTGSLTTVQAFTSLSIITLVTSPAEQLLAVVPQIAAALGCFDRLQAYLTSPSRQDSRLQVFSRKSSLSSIPQEKGHGDLEFSSIPPNFPQPPLAIIVEKATIFPAPNATAAAIADASFTVEAGSLTVLLGPVGSGKTSLIKAVLGELTCKSGSISVASKGIAFCSQSSWLLNISVKESICGRISSEIDQEWYETVLHACALDQDVLQWPDGDRSLIGSKGLTLSGGQKQRVALARAIYARQHIILLDDIFSALDAKTQEMISTRLLTKEGLLRRLLTTVVLVTHNARCLRLADKIVVLNSSGRSIMQGTYQELSQREGFLNYTTAESNESGDKVVVPIPNGDQKSGEPSQGAKTDTIMELTRRTGDLKVYYYYIKNVMPLIWIGFVVVTALVAFADNFPFVWLNWWTQAGGQKLSLYLQVYAALALMASILSILSIWVVFLNLMPQAAIRLHQILLNSVIHAPLSFFASTDTGVTLNRFSQDMSLVDLPLPIALLTVFGSLFGCIAKVALISTGSSYMAVTIPFTLLAIYIIQDVYLKTSRQLRYLDLENKSPLYSHFIETLDGLATIRAFGWEHTAKETQNRSLDYSQRPYYMLLCVQRWLNLVLDLMVTALAVIVVALAVNLKSTTNAGLLGLALNNVLGFNNSISALVTSWTSLETSLGAVARVKTFAETTPSEDKPGEILEPPPEWPTYGSVEINCISATYGTSVSALDGISMSIAPGQKIGICGRTGSGKSSLIITLLRLLPVSSGSITIDGLDISTISLHFLRQRLTAIPQESFILPGTVRANADPLGLASDAEITSALTIVGIWDALQSRGGLDAVLLENPLSQGQHQLFGLARAMLRKSSVLIIDEATSSVDGDTDRVIQQVIRKRFKECTVISVAHRLDTIIDYDKIAVMDGGKLVEFDSPKNLLARESLFKEMYRA